MFTACNCIEYDQALLTFRSLYAVKIKITYTPPIYATSTLEVCNHIFLSRYTRKKLFYSYTESKHPNPCFNTYLLAKNLKINVVFIVIPL
jgi:hypothetical protein